MQAINDFILGHAGDPWVLCLVFGLAIIDAVLPPFPSESVVIGLAAASASGAGEPNPIFLLIIAACGAFIGDNLVFAASRYLGIHSLRDRFRSKDNDVRARLFSHIDNQLEHRGAALILVARYIPVGRVLVNLTAGASSMSHRRFMLFDAVAVILWASYGVLLGTLAGSWIKENPLLGAVLGIALAVAIGLALERIVSSFLERKQKANSPSH